MMDEFDDLFELSAEDLARLDAAVAQQQDHRGHEGIQQATTSAVQIEDLPSVFASQESLWSRFRAHRGWQALSVTDLTSPSWCEVQHTYRLESKAHLPLSERPASFRTSTGAEVLLDRGKTEAREKVLEGGRQVHLVLEKEVMGEEKVEVQVDGKEEWWALRILNLLVGLDTLISGGKAREVPVVGFVEGFLVFGVVDEIEKRARQGPSTPQSPAGAPATPLKSTPRQAKKRKSSASPEKSPSKGKRKETASPASPSSLKGQATLDSFFSKSPPKPLKRSATEHIVIDIEDEPILILSDTEDAPPVVVADATAPAEPTVVPPQWTLIVTDTKTRRTNSLPNPSETLSARHQLMLYLRMLVSLLRPESYSPPSSASKSSTSSIRGFEWSLLFAKLRVDPALPLSLSFKSSAAVILSTLTMCIDNDVLPPIETVQDFVDLLVKVGAGLEGMFEGELEISYRLREKARRWKTPKKAAAKKDKKTKGSKQVPTRAVLGEDQERDDMELAIALSLIDAMERDSQPASQLAGTSRRQEDEPESQSQELFSMAASLPGHEAMEVDALPSALGELDAFPVNSQVKGKVLMDDADESEDGVIEIATGGRYNLRSTPGRRRAAASQGAGQDAGLVAVLATPQRNSRKRRVVNPLPRAVTPPPDTAAVSSDNSDSDIEVLPSSPEEMETGSLIGTSAFKYDPAVLNSWLIRVTALWRGERKPEGVALEQVHRCRTCEFEAQCEWREKKATEALEKFRAAKQTQK